MLEMAIDKIDVKVVEADAVRPMRQRLLRPNQPIEAMVYPGDTSPGTFHLAAVDLSGKVLGIGSFYKEAHPVDPGLGDWRLRGMAVDTVLQGKGLGGRLVQAGLGRIRQQAGRRLWCNARVSAQGFYEKLGYAVESDVFEIKPIGPHVVMSIAVDAESR